MKKYYALLAFVFLFVSNAAIAASTPSIDLVGGSIPPGGKFSVDLAALKDNVKYRIRCKLSSSEKTIVNISATAFNNVYVRAIMNGQDIGNIVDGTNAIVNSGNNELVLPEFFYLTGASYNSSLDFINRDKDITVDVSECKAQSVA